LTGIGLKAQTFPKIFYLFNQ